MRARTLILGLSLALSLTATAAMAVDPNEMLSDPGLELRARNIGKGLRCLVCQNQSIDDSDASLARDLRRLVRERIVAGDSDAAVVDYVVSRYGDYVLLNPPFKAATLALWLGPAVIAGLGLGAVVVHLRRRRAAGTAGVPPLSADEKRRLAALLKDDSQ